MCTGGSTGIDAGSSRRGRRMDYANDDQWRWWHNQPDGVHELVVVDEKKKGLDRSLKNKNRTKLCPGDQVAKTHAITDPIHGTQEHRGALIIRCLSEYFS